MAKGRKRIPTKIHQLRGFPGKRQPNALEPKPPPGMPECPSHLDELAKAEWARVYSVVEDMELITRLDMAALAGHCHWYSVWVQSSIKVHELGMVYKRKDGTPAHNPYVRTSGEAYDRMLKADVLLGFTPSSRSGLKVNKKDEKSKVHEFMKKKHG